MDRKNYVIVISDAGNSESDNVVSFLKLLVTFKGFFL